MKFKLYFLVASLLIALFQEVAIASGVKTYRNNQLGFEISYLDNWEESHTFGNPAFFIKRKSPAEPGTISINIANFTGNKDD